MALYAAVTLTISTAALASTQAQPFVLSAYGAAAGGEDLLAGRYPAALRQLQTRAGSTPDPTARSANDCVAFEMTQHKHAAQTACDAAVRAATDARLEAAPSSGFAMVRADRALAAAYCNQAVARWLSGDQRGARAALERARLLAPQARFVLSNLAALQSHALEENTHGG